MSGCCGATGLISAPPVPKRFERTGAPGDGESVCASAYFSKPESSRASPSLVFSFIVFAPRRAAASAAAPA